MIHYLNNINENNFKTSPELNFFSFKFKNFLFGVHIAYQSLHNSVPKSSSMSNTQY
jgi:hypothetical protein